MYLTNIGQGYNLSSNLKCLFLLHFLCSDFCENIFTFARVCVSKPCLELSRAWWCILFLHNVVIIFIIIICIWHSDKRISSSVIIYFSVAQPLSSYPKNSSADISYSVGLIALKRGSSSFSFLKGSSAAVCAEYWLELLTLHKKWNFPLRISSVNVTKCAVSCPNS